MQATVTVTKPASAAKPFRRWVTYTALAGTAVLVILGIVLIRALMSDDGVPPINADTVTLVKFLSTSDYADLHFERQQLYMRVLEDREDNDEIKNAFKSGKITESEYRAALSEAWLGQQLKRADKFGSLPSTAARVAYVDELLNRKEEKDSRKPTQPVSSDNTAGPKVKRDTSMEDVRIAALPPDVKRKWDEFRKAYKERKDARDPASPVNAQATEVRLGR